MNNIIDLNKFRKKKASDFNLEKTSKPIDTEFRLELKRWLEEGKKQTPSPTPPPSRFEFVNKIIDKILGRNKFKDDK